MIGTSKEALEVILDPVLCIHYPVQFQKDKETVWALIDSGSKVNAMTLAYTKQLGRRTQKTDVDMGWSLPPFRLWISLVELAFSRKLFY